MPLYEIQSDGLRELATTSFHAQNLRERQDLQRLFRNNVGVITPDILVLAEEFGDWEDSRRRIDLLGIDRDANLIVIELKRTDDGGHMELQAIRYAAMVSTMTFDDAVDAYASFISKQGKETNARESLLQFLGWDEPEEDRFAQDVQMILVSADFSREITSAVLWLNERSLDIRCVRLVPYIDQGRVLLDFQQVIPLPEAEEYQVRTKAKAQREKADRSTNTIRHQRRYQFWAELIARCEGKTHLHTNITPNVYSWIGTGSGVRGLGLNYSLRQHDTTVELYIDRGKHADHENKQIFNFLLNHRAAIEGKISFSLEWEELEDRRACRIKSALQMGGWRDDPETWGPIHDTMIGHMVKLESALRPYLDQIQKMDFAQSE